MASSMEASSVSFKSLAAKLSHKFSANDIYKPQMDQLLNMTVKMMEKLTTVVDSAMDEILGDLGASSSSSSGSNPSGSRPPTQDRTAATSDTTRSSSTETATSDWLQSYLRVMSAIQRLQSGDSTKSSWYDAFTEPVSKTTSSSHPASSTKSDKHVTPTDTADAESSRRPGVERSRRWSKSEPSLLIGNARDIRQVNAQTGQKHIICDEFVNNAVAVDFDKVNNVVFWTDVKDKNITRAVLDTSGFLEQRQSLVQLNVLVPDGLAYDWVHQNLYWTDTGSDRIEVLSLRKTGPWMSYEDTMQEILGRTTVISSDLDEPRAIVVDPRPKQRMLYWSDWGKSAKVERSSLDGSQRQLLISTNIGWPNGLTLDMATDRLYWVDAKLYSIFSCTLDGHDRQLVYKSHSYLSHPFSVAVFNSEIYWTDWHSQSVFKTQLKPVSAPDASASSVQRVASGLATPFDIKLVHNSKQPLYADVCAEAQCSHICLPTAVRTQATAEYRCACPNDVYGYRVSLDSDGRQCHFTPAARLVAQVASDTSPVVGVTSLDDVIYVVRHESRYVDLYDSSTRKLLRHVIITDMRSASDVTSSARHRCVYIADLAGKTIYRLTADGKNVTRWSVPDGPYSLSLTGNDNLLVTCTLTSRLQEFTTDGRLVRDVVVERSSTLQLWHAIGLSDGQFVVALGGGLDSVHQVCKLNTLGKPGKCYGGLKGSKVGQVSSPAYLAQNGRGSVLVLCLGSQRVIELTAGTMAYVGTVLSGQTGITSTYSMHYDTATQHLYLTDNTWTAGGSVEVFQLGAASTAAPPHHSRQS